MPALLAVAGRRVTQGVHEVPDPSQGQPGTRLRVHADEVLQEDLAAQAGVHDREPDCLALQLEQPGVHDHLGVGPPPAQACVNSSTTWGWSGKYVRN